MSGRQSAARPRVGVPTEIVLADRVRVDAADVDVRFESAPGETLLVPAFQAGDLSVRVRFAAPHEGTWTWTTSSIQPDLADLRGELIAEPYDGGNQLYGHGRIRVSDDRRTLQHADGTPFLWTGDTWWMGLTNRIEWPSEFSQLLDDRAAKGFSVIQIVAGPLPEFSATPSGIWDPSQANEAGWPWEQGWKRPNGAFYDAADRRIEAIVEAGIVPCIVGMWGFYLTLMGDERVRRHWRNLVARYAAYPVVFCVAGEVNLPPVDGLDASGQDAARSAQATGWGSIAHYVRNLDPYRNPVTAHPAHPDVRRVLSDSTGLDINMIQTSHWSYQIPSIETRNSLDELLGLAQPIRFGLAGALELTQEAVAQTPTMPVVNGEPCYEGIMGSNWQDVQRFLYWSGMLSGLAGFTYGAQGIWQMNSATQPDRFRPRWGSGYWQDAMHYPGGRQIALGRELLGRFEWWKLRPVVDQEAIAGGRSSALGATTDHAAVYYLPSLITEERWHGVRGLPVDVSKLRGPVARFVDPRTMRDHHIGLAEPTDAGRWQVPETPSMEDWLLVVESGNS